MIVSENGIRRMTRSECGDLANHLDTYAKRAQSQAWLGIWLALYIHMYCQLVTRRPKAKCDKHAMTIRTESISINDELNRCNCTMGVVINKVITEGETVIVTLPPVYPEFTPELHLAIHALLPLVGGAYDFCLAKSFCCLRFIIDDSINFPFGFNVTFVSPLSFQDGSMPLDVGT